ncbi:MAG: ABC transporter permease [Solirubrobacterales bacterium]|nr:ABC transporter permease [Solirubrobacterales bacterium]
MSLLLAAGGPVLPNFGSGPCPGAEKNALFCSNWFTQNWGSTLWPALVQHVLLTAVAIVIGFIISTALALLAYRVNWVERPILIVTSILYTIPSLALFELLVNVPGLGLSTTTVELALVSYTLLILFRNTLTGLRDVPGEVRDAARGMGMSDRESLLRVEVPLALPAIIAGVRIAVVTVISLATIGAFLIHQGLGSPIFDAVTNNGGFKTELISAGALAIILALFADGLFVLLQRVLTPWARA